MPTDLIAQEFARRLAARTTRRSALGRISRFVLSLVGVSIVTLGPVRRAFGALDPKWCGLAGKPCSNCAAGSEFACPSGCSAGGESWTWCCPDPGGVQNSMMEYWDCCKVGDPPNCGMATVEPHGAECYTALEPWCPSGSGVFKYCCSIIVNTSIPC